MSLFSAFTEQGFSALTQTLENIGNIVAPIDEHENSDFARSYRTHDNDDSDNDEEYSPHHAHDDQNTSIDSDARSNSFSSVDLNDLDSSNNDSTTPTSLSTVDLDEHPASTKSNRRLQPSSSRSRLQQLKNHVSSTANPVAFLSNPELEKKVQARYRQQLENSVMSLETANYKLVQESAVQLQMATDNLNEWRKRALQLEKQLNTTNDSNRVDSHMECAHCTANKAHTSDLLQQLARLQATSTALSSQQDLSMQSEVVVNQLKAALEEQRQTETHLQVQIQQLTAEQDEKRASQARQIEFTKQLQIILQLDTLPYDAAQAHALLLSTAERICKQQQTVLGQSKELEDLQREHQTLQQSLEHLKQQQQTRINEVQTLKTALASTEAALTESEGALKQCEELNWVLKGENSELQYNLEQYVAAEAALKQQLASMHANSSNIGRSDDNNADSVATASAAQTKQMDELARIRDEMQALIATHEQTVLQLHALQLQHAELADEHDITTKFLAEEKNLLKEEFLAANNKIAALEQTFSAHDASSHSHESHHLHQIENLAGLKDIAEQKCSKLTKELEELQREYQTLQQSQEQLQQQQQQLNDSTQTNSRLAVDLQQQLQHEREEYVGVLSRLDVVTSAKSKADRALEKALEDNHRLTQQLALNEQQLAAVKQHASSAAEQVLSDYAALQAQHDALQSQLQQQQEALQEFGQTETDLSAQLLSAQHQLQQQRDNLKQQLDAAALTHTGAISDLQTQLSAARVQHQQQHATLQQAYDHAVQHIRYLEATFNQHQDDFQQTQQQLQQTTADKEATEQQLASVRLNLQNLQLQHQQVQLEFRKLLNDNEQLERTINAAQQQQQEQQQQQLQDANNVSAINSTTSNNTNNVNDHRSNVPPLCSDDASMTTELQQRVLALELELQSTVVRYEQQLTAITALKMSAEQELLSLKQAHHSADRAGTHHNSSSSLNQLQAPLDGDTAKPQIAKLETENRQLHQVIAQLRHSRISSKQDSDSAIQERDQLRLTVEQQCIELRNLKAMLVAYNEARTHADKLQQECNALKDWSARTEQQLAEVQQQLSITEREKYDTFSKNENLHSDLLLCRQELTLKDVELRNLNAVLVQFEREKTTFSERLQQQFDAKLQQLQQTFDADIQSAEQELQHALVQETQKRQQAEEHAQDQELFRRKAEIEHSKERKKMQATLEHALKQLGNSQDDVVDRTLVANLIVNYFQRNRSREVLDLISRVLSFSSEQRVAVGLQVGNLNFLQSIVSSVLGPPPVQPLEDIEGDNLAELWINFLINESEATTPQKSKVRMPASSSSSGSGRSLSTAAAGANDNRAAAASTLKANSYG